MIRFMVCILFATSLCAQPDVVWQRCLGGSSLDSPKSIQATPDGGFITCGISYSNFNGDVSGGYGAGDFWVVKLDATGNIQWEKSLGGSWTDGAEDVQPTSDGGYVVAGFTTSSNGLVTNFHGMRDFWVVKLNSVGDVEWQKALGGSSEEGAFSVTEAHGEGYLVTGRIFSKDGDAQSPGYEYFDIWVVKLDENGSIEWERKYGGNGADLGFCIRKAHGSGYYLSGQTSSNDGDVSGNNGNFDFWVARIENGGAIIWQRSLGGIGTEGVRSLYPTQDGGCILTGETGSVNSGQVIGHHGLFDVWAVKLDSIGNIEWQRPLGGSEQDHSVSVIQTNDGSFVIAAMTLSTDGDVQGHDGSDDLWLIKLDSSGELIWQKTFGGTQSEVAGGITQTHDGSLVFCGETRSNDGDVSGNHGQEDFWVVKLSAESSGDHEAGTQSLGIQPNPAGDRVRISAGWEEAMLQVVICDALGRVALHRSIQNNDYIDLSTLPDGLYFLQAVGHSGAHYAGKVLKQRE